MNCRDKVASHVCKYLFCIWIYTQWRQRLQPVIIFIFKEVEVNFFYKYILHFIEREKRAKQRQKSDSGAVVQYKRPVKVSSAGEQPFIQLLLLLSLSHRCSIWCRDLGFRSIFCFNTFIVDRWTFAECRLLRHECVEVFYSGEPGGVWSGPHWSISSGVWLTVGGPVHGTGVGCGLRSGGVQEHRSHRSSGHLPPSIINRRNSEAESIRSKVKLKTETCLHLIKVTPAPLCSKNKCADAVYFSHCQQNQQWMKHINKDRKRNFIFLHMEMFYVEKQMVVKSERTENGLIYYDVNNNVIKNKKNQLKQVQWSSRWEMLSMNSGTWSLLSWSNVVERGGRQLCSESSVNKQIQMQMRALRQTERLRWWLL